MWLIELEIEQLSVHPYASHDKRNRALRIVLVNPSFSGPLGRLRQNK